MKIASVLAIGAFSLSGSAWAQTALPQRRVDLGATATTSYESNLLRLPDGIPAPPGGSRSDFRFTPALTLDLQLPLGRQAVSLAGAIGYDFHRRNTQLNRERFELTAGADLNLSSCGSILRATFSRQQSDLADILTTERLSNTESRRLFLAEITCGSSLGLQPHFGYQNEHVENSDRVRQSGNYTSQTFSAGVGYSRPVFGRLSLSGSYQRGAYDERPVDQSLGGLERIEVYTGSIDFNRKIGSQLTGNASLGYVHVDPNLPDVDKFSGLSWSADLVWTPGTRIQASLGASREAKQSNLLSISYAIVDSYRGSLQYALSERIRLSAAATHTRRTFRNRPNTPQLLLQDNDRDYFYSAGASMLASRRVTLSLEGRSEQRRSTNPLFNYDNVAVILTTTLNL